MRSTSFRRRPDGFRQLLPGFGPSREEEQHRASAQQAWSQQAPPPWMHLCNLNQAYELIHLCYDSLELLATSCHYPNGHLIPWKDLSKETRTSVIQGVADFEGNYRGFYEWHKRHKRAHPVEGTDGSISCRATAGKSLKPPLKMSKELWQALHKLVHNAAGSSRVWADVPVESSLEVLRKLDTGPYFGVRTGDNSAVMRAFFEWYKTHVVQYHKTSKAAKTAKVESEGMGQTRLTKSSRQPSLYRRKLSARKKIKRREAYRMRTM